MHYVRPGCLDTYARSGFSVMALMREDLPTLDIPTTAISGSLRGTRTKVAWQLNGQTTKDVNNIIKTITKDVNVRKTTKGINNIIKKITIPTKVGSAIT